MGRRHLHHPPVWEDLVSLPGILKPPGSTVARIDSVAFSGILEPPGSAADQVLSALIGILKLRGLTVGRTDNSPVGSKQT
jgi:hypothetical protein